VFERIAALAHDAGRRCSVTIGASFGCPFEGEVPVARLREVVGRLAAVGPDEISLADTIGVAVPTDVTERIAVAREAAPGIALRAHFHNTRNTGLANAVAAVESGVEALDASLGGIGGCPFAPAATGNIPSEDLVYLLHRMGVDTGIDAAKMIEAVGWLEETLDRRVPGMLAKAGLFPASAS
jgi:hydroxymethylglutaryl-CoA lyase